MATTTGTDAARTVLGALGGLVTPPTHVAAGVPDAGTLVDVGLVILQSRLNDVVAGAPELNPIAVEVAALLADATEVVTAQDMVTLAARVRSTNTWLSYAAPAIKAAVGNAQPGLWIGELSSDITKKAWAIKGLRADAVRKAWYGGPVEAAWLLAENADAAFPNYVCDRYLHALPGVQGQITVAGLRRDYLAGLKATTGTALSGTPALDDVQIGAVDAANAWVVQLAMSNDLSLYRSEFDVNQPGVQAAVQSLTLRVQRINLMLTALTFDEEVTWAAAQLVAITDLVDRLNGYHAELQTIIANLHDGFVHNGGPQQAAGVAALVELASRAAFVTDRDSAVTQLNIQNALKTAAIAVTVTAAAALTGGAAGAMAGAAIGALAGEGAAAAVFVGSLAAEAITFTAVSRLANSVIYGDVALQDTSFWEELLWNAAMIGALRVVEYGFPRIFVKVGEGSAAYRVGLTSTRQLTLLALGIAQRRAHSGEWPGLGDTGVMALNQIVMTAMLHVGGQLAGSFTSRFGAIAARMDQQKVAQLDQNAEALATQRQGLTKDGLTQDDIDAFIAAVDAQWTDEVAGVEAMPDTDPDKAATLARYAAGKAETELILAASGFEPALGHTDQPPSFSPNGPGEVTYADGARPVIDGLYADPNRPGTVVETAEPGVLIGTSAGGRVTAFLPAGDFAGPPAPPAQLITGERAAADAADPDLSDVAATGLANLTAMFPGRLSVDSVLAQVGPENVGNLVTLLGHAAFDPQAGPRRYSKNDIVALGTLDEARWFAARHSPTLALKIKVVGGGRSTNAFSPRAIDLLRRADTLIGQAAEADRPALVTELEALSAADLRTRLLPAKPVGPKRASISIDSLGIDPETPGWETHLAIELSRNPTRPQPLTLEQMQGRAGVRQALEHAQEGRFRRYKAYTSRIAIMNQLDVLLTPATYPITITANKVRGAMGEILFSPNYQAGSKLAFLNGRVVQHATEGSAEPDYVFVLNDGFAAGELKSDLIHLATSEAAVRGTVGVYRDKAIKQIPHLPSKTWYILHFVRIPTDTIKGWVIDELGKEPGPRFNEVRFGNETVGTLIPRDPNLPPAP